MEQNINPIDKSMNILATHSSVLAWRIPGMGEPGGLPFPSPGDLPKPGIKPRSPALQTDALLSEPPGKAETMLLSNLHS